MSKQIDCKFLFSFRSVSLIYNFLFSYFSFFLFLSCPLLSTYVFLVFIVIFWLFLKICEKILQALLCVFRPFRTIAKSDYYLRHVCQSVCPRGSTRFLLNGSSLNLILEYFSKICRENTSFIKISQK